MFKIIKVAGLSLSPFFIPGDFVLLNTSRGINSKIQTGDIVVFDHPEYGQLIKTVLTNDRDKYLLKVSGLHTDSITIQKLGPIHYRSIIGKVLFHIKKPRSKSN